MLKKMGLKSDTADNFLIISLLAVSDLGTIFLSTSFSVMCRDNSMISVALESYDKALPIVICYVPDGCIPGTQGSADCTRNTFFKF